MSYTEKAVKQLDKTYLTAKHILAEIEDSAQVLKKEEDFRKRQALWALIQAKQKSLRKIFKSFARCLYSSY